MKATIGIEKVGGSEHILVAAHRAVLNRYAPGVWDGLIGPNVESKVWVAEITGSDLIYKYSRKFLKCKVDYSKANSKGTRGVIHWFILETGKIYEVESPVSWSRKERYFCKISECGDIIKIDKSEVDKWVKENTLE